MAKMYNIAERLAGANQKPVIKLDDTHEYKVNTSTAAALMAETIASDEKLNNMERMEKLIILVLGKEANDYMVKQEYTLPAYTLIVNAVMAAMSDTPFEEFEETLKDNRFQEEEKGDKQ
jgi:hypothetical protein